MVAESAQLGSESVPPSSISTPAQNGTTSGSGDDGSNSDNDVQPMDTSDN